MTRAKRFVGNFSWSLAGQLALAALNLLFIPILVRGLGLERYGLYVLLFAAANYLSLSVLGAGTTTVKFVAEAVGAKDGTKLRRTLKYSALAHAVGPALAGVLLAAAAPVIARRLFHVDEALLPQAAFVLRCAAAGALFWSFTQWGVSALQGLQRFDASNAVSLVQAGIGTAGAALLVKAGYGLRAASSWYVAANVAACILALGFSTRLIRPARALPEGKGVTPRQFASWSLSLWLGPLAWLITFQLDKLFIARAASLSALTLYAVPANLLQRLQILPMSVSAVAVPMMSELGGAKEDLARVYLKAQRFVLWLVLPVLAALFAVMPQFLGLWLGGDFGGRSVWPARLLVAAQAFFALIAVPNAVAASKDRPWWVSAVAWGQAVVSVIGWRLLIPRYELLGVATASLLAQIIPTSAYLTAVHDLLGVSWLDFLARSCARPVFCAGLMLGILLAVHARLNSWPAFAAAIIGASALYAAAAWAVADADDRAAARALLRRAA